MGHRDRSVRSILNSTIKGTFSVYHLQYILKLRNLLHRIAQVKLLQFLVGIITDLAFAAADSFNVKSWNTTGILSFVS